jgi:excisionase family DNA binding protein
MESLLTVAEAAAVTKHSPATWRAWILQRRVTVVRLGRSVRIPIGEIERLVSEGTTQAMSESPKVAGSVLSTARRVGEP